MNISGIKLGLMEVFNWVFILAFGYILLNIIISPFSLFGNMNPFVVVLGACLLIIILFIINKLLTFQSEKTMKMISIGSFFIIFLLQMFFGRYFKVYPTWDFGWIYYQGIELSQQCKPLENYFYSCCSNNIPILLLVTGIIKFFRMVGLNDMLTSLIFINIIVVLLSIYVMYLTIKEIYGLQRATLFSIVTVLITPFYTYTTIIYTDTLGLIFPILSIYLYFKIYKSGDFNFLNVILLGIVFGIGGLFKTHAAIVLIAVLIHYFITNRPHFIKLSISVIVPVILILISYKSIIRPLMPNSYEELAWPKTHWIMMGLKGNGIYDEEEATFTRNLEQSGVSKKEIQDQHLEIIKERLKNYGIKGLLTHLNSKLNFTWSDGTYYAPNKLEREPISKNTFQDYIFGDKNLPYLYLSQMVHVLILFLMWLSSIRILKDKLCFESIMTLSVFGVMLFLLIWETRSRYLMIYLPVFVVLASYGFGEFTQMIQKIKRQ